MVAGANLSSVKDRAEYLARGIIGGIGKPSEHDRCGKCPIAWPYLNTHLPSQEEVKPLRQPMQKQTKPQQVSVILKEGCTLDSLMLWKRAMASFNIPFCA